jgi:uncharacterized protein YjbI with pentapeptide repeats
LGGIYALEQLARTSPRDQPAIVEVLSAFVREHAPRADGSNCNRTQQLPTDIQAALTVLGRRDTAQDGPAEVNLRDACLAQANLANAQLAKAHLYGVDLTAAHLAGAKLAEAAFHGANLTDAVLYDADLSGAFLNAVNLTRVNLTRANLTRADLTQTTFTDADITDAHLVNIYSFDDTDVTGATWSEQTQWPPKYYAKIREHSQSDSNGKLRIGQLRLSDS